MAADTVSMGGGYNTECGWGEGILNLGMQFAKRVKKSGGREFANFNWVICLSSAAKQVNTEAASKVATVSRCWRYFQGNFIHFLFSASTHSSIEFYIVYVWSQDVFLQYLKPYTIE